MRIIEFDDVLRYLEKRKLTKQYIKAKLNVESGRPSGTQLRKREPKSDDVWYFRITKKYRALCIWEGDTLTVFNVDDHQ